METSNPPVISDNGTTEDDAAVFYVNNQIYEGFKDIRLSRSLTSLTGSFEIVLVDKWMVEKADFDMKPGLRIACKIGKKSVYTGYIDKLNISLSSSSRNITISGRDKTGDLVDCSHVGRNEFNNMRLEAIAKELVKPFGIDVIIFASTGEPFTKFTITQGDSVFQALEKLAKQRNLLLTSSPEGNLVFEKKGIIRSSTELIEGVNIKSAGISLDNTERFSQYHVKSQAIGIIGNAQDASQAKGTASDEGIDRYRPIVILNESQGDGKTAQQRAEWEASLRSAKACNVSVVVVGWTQRLGELWATNQVVHIDCPSIGVKQDMLISKVNFELSENGKITELELIRPDAFEFKAKIKKEKDPLDLLGWSVKK
jgi:prophage tail gpP-like protein